MWSIFVPIAAGDSAGDAHGTGDAHKDIVIAELWDCGACGFMEEGETGIRAYFEDSVSPEAITALWGGTARLEREFEPGDFERQDWEPLPVGDRFLIAPPWLSAEAPPGRVRLEIDASTAFGTGRHESTQLCLQAPERCIKQGDIVLDVGCGSGILIAAAELLGAGQTIGCDISFDALTIARLHVRAPVFAGSADAIRGGLADVTIANISPSSSY